MKHLKKNLKYYIASVIVFILLFFSIFLMNSKNLLPYETLIKIKEQSIFLILDEKIELFIKEKEIGIFSSGFYLAFIVFFMFYISAIILNTVSNTVLDQQPLYRYITAMIIHSIVQIFLNIKKRATLALFILVPFAHFYSDSYTASIIIFISIVLSLIVSIYYSYRKDAHYIWFLKKWLLINIPITCLVFLVALNFYDIKINNNLADLYSLILFFTLFYTIVSFMRVLIKTFWFLISLDYIQANKQKSILSHLNAYVPISYLIWRENNLDLINFIDETKSKSIFTSKLELMKKRKTIIQDRNYINLAISSGYIIAAFLGILFLIILSVENLEESLLKATAFLILMFLIRLLSRSFEILKAFMNDALSAIPKQSTLTKNDRIKLILLSLLEIVILSVGLKTLYSIFINPKLIHISTELSKDIIIDFFDIWAVQLFNVSFTNDVDFLPALVHIIQISISACLILLSLAVYSGHKNNTSIYEMTKENGIYYFSETFIVNTVEDNENVRTIEGDEKMNHTRYSQPKRDFSGFKKDWEEDRIDTELFEQIEFCYKELENKEALHQEQTDFLLKLFDDIQKIKGFFKKLNRF